MGAFDPFSIFWSRPSVFGHLMQYSIHLIMFSIQVAFEAKIHPGSAISEGEWCSGQMMISLNLDVQDAYQRKKIFNMDNELWFKN